MQSRLLALIAIAGVTLVASASLAGELFRLEIGPPIAAGALAGKKAVLVVRPLCCDPATVRITGTAEGIVDGSRRSIPLDLERLATRGVHAVTRQWPAGEWVLNLTGTCAERNATATAVVPLDSKGAFVRERARFFERVATTADIEASFQSAGSR